MHVAMYIMFRICLCLISQDASVFMQGFQRTDESLGVLKWSGYSAIYRENAKMDTKTEKMEE
jgi:hypothetical protein